MMANSCGIEDEDEDGGGGFDGGAAAGSNGGGEKLKHNPGGGISLDWSLHEQSILQDALSKYASDSTLIRYAKIAMMLQDKTVRDVAFRCRWMTKKENSKRRKEDHNVSRKSKDKKERVGEQSAKLAHLASRPSVPPYAMPMISLDGDDDISCKAIGGAMGQLLEQNAQAFNQISANFTNYQYQENMNMFCQARDNIFSILNNLNDMPETMRQMPPLPVKLNEDLATTVLGRPAIK